MAGKPKRAVILSILGLMGAEYTSKITIERACKKLQRHVEKKGVPEGMNEEQTEVMGWLGLLPKDGTEEEPKAKAKPKAAAKKAAAKKAAPKAKAEEEPEEEEPKPKAKKAAPKGPRLNWMRVATQAILGSKNMKAAAAKAVDIYREKGGTMTPKSDEWGRLYTGYAEKVLQECGHISLDSDGNITVL